MNARTLLLLFQCSLGPMAALAGQTNQIAIFPGDASSPGNLKLVWPATPGLRYEVQQSTNLQSWTTAPGYPAAASGPAQQMLFQTTGNAGFFKVNQLDEQPPAIVSQYPQDGGFAVPRFANLTMQLSDATGIDTNSIQLTVGSLGTFTFTNAQLTFSNNLLTFINGGSIPLGVWGTNVQVTLIMADTLGNVGTNTWSFTLESQPQVVTNLFVFGSPQAQRVGQQIGNIPTRALVKQSGPIPMDSGYPWTLSQVASNYLILSYTNTTPGFTVGQYVCNLTPASPAEIFNRKINSISDDPGHKLLTLFTVEVPLTEIVTNGSASISSDSMILQMGTNGAFTKAFSVSGTVTFPRIGYSLDGADFKLRQNGFESTINGVTLSVGDPPDLLHVTAEQLHWWLTPQLQASLEINWGHLQRFQAIASGTVDQASIWDADVLLAGADVKQTIFQLPPGSQPEMWVFLGSILGAPVYAKLVFDFKLEAEEEAQATLSFRSGESQSVDASFGVTYNSPNDVEWVHTFNFPQPTVVPFTANINAEGSVKLSLEPEVDFLVYGLAGVSAGITPSASVVFQAGTSQPLSGDLEADVSLDLGLAGPAFEVLNFTPQFSLSLWSDEWHLFPDEPNISFDQQPQSQSVTAGSSVNFSCTVTATGTPSYQWYFNGVPMPGQTSRTLSLPSVSSGYAGNYYVNVSAGGQTTNSASATLTVISPALQTGLVAYYPLDGNANDASGNGNNATFIGGVANAPDRFGRLGMAAFIGTSERISLPSTSALRSSAITYSFWYQAETNILTDQPNNSICVLLNSGPDHHPLLFMNASPGSAPPGTPAMTLGYWYGNFYGANYIIPIGQWTHFCLVINGSSRNIYINGSSIFQANDYFGNNGYPVTDIGNFPGDPNTHSARGAFDDVRIYNRALSDSEILQLYNASQSALCPILPTPRLVVTKNCPEAPVPPGGMLFYSGTVSNAGNITLTNVIVVNNRPTNNTPILGSIILAPHQSTNFSGSYRVCPECCPPYVDTITAAGAQICNGSNVTATATAYCPGITTPKLSLAVNCPPDPASQGQLLVYSGSVSNAGDVALGDILVTDDKAGFVTEILALAPGETEEFVGFFVPTNCGPNLITLVSATAFDVCTGGSVSNQISASCLVICPTNGYAYDLATAIGYDPTFNDGVYPYTSPVGYFAPNGYGLYDMAGNVWQWCWDLLGDYSSGSQTDPRGPASGSILVRRGGSWGDYALGCRTAIRDVHDPADGSFYLGFRSILPPGQ